MSNNQTPTTGERGRPTSRQGHPHFRPIPPMVHSTHEQAVIDAGYPWVRTNPLAPTWMSPDADPRSITGTVPDRLNYHGHHGVNTHLIIEGDLTLMSLRRMFGQNHVSAVTLSMEFGSLKELSVAPGEIYAGTTQQACKFVEGHRNLSPRSAHRLYKAEFETKFDFTVMRRVATCTFKDDNQITRAMRQWFLREWNDPDAQAAKGDLRNVIHPLETQPAPQWRGRETHAAANDETDSLDDELDLDEERGGRGLIRAFKEWLLGVTEN